MQIINIYEYQCNLIIHIGIAYYNVVNESADSGNIYLATAQHLLHLHTRKMMYISMQCALAHLPGSKLYTIACGA